MGHLCCESGGDGDVVMLPGTVMHWHLPTFTDIVHVTIALRHELMQWESPVQQDTGLSVLTEHHVIVFQSSS